MINNFVGQNHSYDSVGLAVNSKSKLAKSNTLTSKKVSSVSSSKARSKSKRPKETKIKQSSSVISMSGDVFKHNGPTRSSNIHSHHGSADRLIQRMQTLEVDSDYHSMK